MIDDSAMIAVAIKNFPPTFGLARFPGERFRIEPSACYVSDGRVMLYVYVQRNGEWLAFSKGTVAELSGQIVRGAR
jgi:hypothetical protein